MIDKNMKKSSNIPVYSPAKKILKVRTQRRLPNHTVVFFQSLIWSSPRKFNLKQLKILLLLYWNPGNAVKWITSCKVLAKR